MAKGKKKKGKKSKNKKKLMTAKKKSAKKSSKKSRQEIGEKSQEVGQKVRQEVESAAPKKSAKKASAKKSPAKKKAAPAPAVAKPAAPSLHRSRAHRSRRTAAPMAAAPAPSPKPLPRQPPSWALESGRPFSERFGQPSFAAAFVVRFARRRTTNSGGPGRLRPRSLPGPQRRRCGPLLWAVLDRHQSPALPAGIRFRAGPPTVLPRRCSASRNDALRPQRGLKTVVGMQHSPTTFCWNGQTPKKSADACLFCFTERCPAPDCIHVRNFMQSVVACPWGARKSD